MARSIEEEIIYHRTYLPKQFIQVCNKDCHDQPGQVSPRRDKWDPELLPPRSVGQFPFNQTYSPPSTPEKQSYFDYTAFRIVGDKLVPWPIVEKPDQDFASYATKFEKKWSRLVSAHNPLNPVIDESLMVIGHVGYIPGMYIYIPKGTYRGNSIVETWRAGTPVFIAESPDQKLWEGFEGIPYNIDAQVNVWTRIDGGVLIVLSKRGERGLVPVDISPLDLIFIGKVVIDFGAGLGRRIGSALVRKEEQKGATIVLEGATEKVAREAISHEAGAVLPKTTGYVRKSGIAPSHFKAFQEAARETKVIVVVRNGKESAIPLIEKGCPGKPKIFEPFNTNERTGILTATTAADKELVYKSNYILIDENRVAMRRLPNGTVEKVELKDPFWQLEPGQVLDPALKKPVVGDYDLMGVFSPKNPGQNITLHSVDGAKLENMTSPIVDQFSKSVNKKMDIPRVLHGAQDQYAGFRKGAIAFFPDGQVLYMETEQEVKALYDSVGRQPIKGSYPRPGPNVPVPPDELAARRARK